MTIGIGFLARNGIVLCSDRQHTSASGFKFAKRKFFASAHISGATAILSYAGQREDAQVLFDKICDRFIDDRPIRKTGDRRDPHHAILENLQKIFRSAHSKNLETLIGIRKDWFPRLFRTSGNRVIMGTTECIGCGDSSVIRYLSDLILGPTSTHVEAAILGSYLISAANRYVDGCSGGPDVIFLPDSNYGKTHFDREYDANFERSIASQVKKFALIEHNAGEALRRSILLEN